MPATFADGTNLRYAAMPADTRNNLASTGMSVAGWLRRSGVDGASNGGQMIELVTAANALVVRLTTSVSGGAFFRFETGHSVTTMQADINPTAHKDHEWIHVAFVWDGGTLNSGVTAYVNGAAIAVTGGRHGSGTVSAPDGSIAVGGGIVNSNRDIVGLLHYVAAWNVQLSATEVAQLAGNGYRAYSPDEIQPTALFINCEFNGNTDNECDATTGTPGAKTGGTPTLTNRIPGDVPGVGFWFKANAGGNTITGSRVATAIDYAGSTLTAVESASSGPIFKDTELGLDIGYSAHSSDSDRYIDNATGATGLPVNARSVSILAFTSGISTQAFVTRNEPRYIAALGDPATNGAGEAELWISTSGFPVGGEAGTTARTTGDAKRLDCASPRLMGAVFRAAGVDTWADDEKTTGGTPCSAATSTGFRLFATPGTRDYWYEGRIYDILIYQRVLDDTEIATIRAAFRDADTTAGVTGSYFSDATGLLATCGSSSMYGYRSDWNENLFALCQPALADRLVYNFGQVSATRSTIAGLVNTHLQAADVLALFPKAARHAIIQPFGNDNDGSGSFGYGGVVTFATVLADIQATVDDLLTDYARVGHWETIARGTIGTDTDTTIAVRERDRQSLFTGLSSVYRLNFDSIAGLAVTQSGDDATLATNVHTITMGANYNADEVHLNDTGFLLLVTQFNTRIDGLLATGGGPVDTWPAIADLLGLY